MFEPSLVAGEDLEGAGLLEDVSLGLGFEASKTCVISSALSAQWRGAKTGALSCHLLCHNGLQVSETMSQIKHFLLLSALVTVFCHSNRKITKTARFMIPGMNSIPVERTLILIKQLLVIER